MYDRVGPVLEVGQDQSSSNDVRKTFERGTTDTYVLILDRFCPGSLFRAESARANGAARRQPADSPCLFFFFFFFYPAESPCSGRGVLLSICFFPFVASRDGGWR